MVLEFPKNPTENQQYPAPNNIIYVYANSAWTSLGAITIGPASVYVGGSAPTTPDVGMMWFNTTLSKLTVYYNSQWTDVVAPS